MTNTKRAIAEAFTGLLMKKPIGRITINDIAEASGISRMTFYYHFKDIYDLAEWVCEESFRQAMRGYTAIEDWDKAFYSVLEVIRDNQNLVMNVYRSIDRERLFRYLQMVIERLFYQVVRPIAEGQEISEETLRYSAGFYSYGMVGVVYEWIEGGMREPPEQIAAVAARIVQLDAASALKRLKDLNAPVGARMEIDLEELV